MCEINVKLCVSCRYIVYDQKEDRLLCSHYNVLSLVDGGPYLECQEVRDEWPDREETCGKEGIWWEPSEPLVTKICNSPNVIPFRPQRTKYGELHKFNPKDRPPPQPDKNGT
jgi:hypothetical protein